MLLKSVVLVKPERLKMRATSRAVSIYHHNSWQPQMIRRGDSEVVMVQKEVKQLSSNPDPVDGTLVLVIATSVRRVLFS